MIGFANRVIVPPHVLVRFFEGESVLLNLETERYFGLDETGTRMWQLLTTLPSVAAAYEQLLSEYDVSSGVLRTNLEELLGRLVSNGLLHVLPADVGSTAAV